VAAHAPFKPLGVASWYTSPSSVVMQPSDVERPGVAHNSFGRGVSGQSPGRIAQERRVESDLPLLFCSEG
jgi:hypothetical protein